MTKYCLKDSFIGELWTPTWYATVEGHTVLLDGYLPNGLRVHVVDDPEQEYPYVWRNALILSIYMVKEYCNE